MKQAPTYLVIVNTNPFAILLQVKKNPLPSSPSVSNFSNVLFRFLLPLLPIVSTNFTHGNNQLNNTLAFSFIKPQLQNEPACVSDLIYIGAFMTSPPDILYERERRVFSQSNSLWYCDVINVIDFTVCRTSLIFSFTVLILFIAICFHNLLNHL